MKGVINLENKFGKKSLLNLEACKKNGQTYVEDLYFTAPLKVMRPFIKDDGGIKIMLLSASAALMAGDEQEINILVNDGADLEFVSQSYEKIHKMDEGCAVKNTVINIGKNAKLKYTPLPVIPFAGSAYKGKTKVYLEDETSKFFMTDIISCGRAVNEERFEYKYYYSLIEIYKAGLPVYRDNARYMPDIFDMEGTGMFEKYSHLANILIFNYRISDENINLLRSYFEENSFDGGITRTASSDICIRLFAGSAFILEKICEDIRKMLAV